jgi:hypothetical protein
VADVCNWTLFCSSDGNIHANDAGHALVATAFEQVVDEFAIATAPLPDANPGYGLRAGHADRPATRQSVRALSPPL